MTLHHSLDGDRRAVGRLLYGAYVSAWIDRAHYENAISSIYLGAGRDRAELEADRRRYPLGRQRGLAPELATVRRRLAGKRLVVADDRLDESGLRLFWAAVAEAAGAKLQALGSARELKALLAADGLAPGDLALVDLDFGAEGRTGIELIQAIRRHGKGELRGLPVVAFTGATDPYLLLQARAAGADFVFLKEVEVAEDDRGAKAFLALATILGEAARLANLHHIWTDIVALREEMRGLVGADDADRIRALLGKAWFYLAHGESDPRLALIREIPKSSVYEESLLNAAKAAELLFLKEYQRLEDKAVRRRNQRAVPGIEWFKDAPRNHASNFKERLSRVVSESRSPAVRALGEGLKALWPRRAQAAHGGLRGSVSEQGAAEVLFGAVKLLRAYAATATAEG